MDTQETNSKTQPTRKTGFGGFLPPFTEIFWQNRAVARAAFTATAAVLALAIFWSFYSAPRSRLIISSGPAGSSFERNAIKYRDILKRNHVKLRIISSEGSEENLKRLDDPSFRVDIAFVQGGVTNGFEKSELVSLGSVAYEPLWIFYRSADPLKLISDFKGRRLAIGPKGSGAHSMALTLFQLNGMETNGPNLLGIEADDATKQLLDGKVDAVFLMGDSASPEVIHDLLTAPGIQLFSFSQADAYKRKISYLNKLELPMGAIDFGRNIPPNNVSLISPTVEILARPNLHPALIDLLLETAREVHGGPKLLQHKNEFPAPLEHDYPISAEASRFYTSGKTFLYSRMPFWLASLVSRILVAFVPVALVLLPGLRLIPAAYQWHIKSLLNRRYRALLSLERELIGQMTSQKREELLDRLDQIEASLNRIKVPASFGDQFYGLRGHIGFVRNRLVEKAETLS